MDLDEADAKGLDRELRKGGVVPAKPAEAKEPAFEFGPSGMIPVEDAERQGAFKPAPKPMGARMLLQSLRATSDMDAIQLPSANRAKKA
jgi:hypothetical protein